MANAYAQTVTTVTAYDVATFAPVGFSGVIPNTASQLGIAISPDFTRIYTTDTNTNFITQLDASCAVLNQLMVGSTGLPGAGPRDCAVSPDGSVLYVTDRGGDTVWVIPTASFASATALVSLHFPDGICITPDGKTLYVSQPSDAQIAVIDIGTATITTTIPTPAGLVVALAITANGQFVYGGDFTNNNEVSISTTSNTIVATVPVGTNPLRVCSLPDGSRVYLAYIASAVATDVLTPANTVGSNVGLTGTADCCSSTPDSSAVWYGENGQIDIVGTASSSLVHTITGTGAITGIVSASATYLPKPPPPPPGTVVPPLFIPRKTSLDPQDLDIDFLAIQDWANRIG